MKKKKVYNHTGATLSPDFTDRNDFTNIWLFVHWCEIQIVNKLYFLTKQVVLCQINI